MHRIKNKTVVDNAGRLRTKIIATIGPASRSEAVIKRLINTGVNICRLNFSHGSPSEHKAVARIIRKIEKTAGMNIAILQDLPGPKIRVGKLRDGSFELIEGRTVVLTTSGNRLYKKIPVNFKKLHKDLKRGRSIFIDDGKLHLRVTNIKGNDIICEVLSGGILYEHKGMNFPDTSLDIVAPTRDDLRLLDYGFKMDIDLAALSYIRSAKDVLKVRRFLKRKGRHRFLISKIEKYEALDNIDEIIEHSDGIMIARGDLGVEIPIEEVPGAQRLIIDKCNFLGKPVITATQMLDSMIERPSPTRAEATDVANAVINGSDALMLSGETAIGKYPVNSVDYLKKIASRAEQSIYWKKFDRGLGAISDTIDTISKSAAEAARKLNVTAILTPTRSGRTAFHVSRFKPKCLIMAFTGNQSTYKELMISWGVESYIIDQDLQLGDIIRRMKAIAKKNRFTKKGDFVIITAGSPDSGAGQTNLMMVEEIK